ncbi:anthranilate synthase, aminase component [Bacillus sp. JCM 19046]|nr:anthranilate synthase, aminase component [Bacillus sp. JCM 19045]GAF20086.1 anthranilate synthase, aminase component [Bacillus sp. JCM 19046]
MKKTSFLSFNKSYDSYGLCFYRDRVFADGLTPTQLFQSFQEEAVFLLESNDSQSEWSNFSFIGLNPLYELIELNGSYLTICLKTKQTLVQASTFRECYDQFMAILQPEPMPLDIPFQGGAVGYVSYDAVFEMEPKLKQTDKQKSSVPKRHFVFCETIVALNERTKELTIVHHLHTKKGSAKQAYDAAESEVQSLLQKVITAKPLDLLPIKAEGVNPLPFQANYSKETFMADVNRVKKYIKQGDVFQTVLSQRFDIAITCSGFELYRVLRLVNPSPYLFYLKIGEKEIIGSSPEKLIEVRGHHLEIHPIAGTRKRGLTEVEDRALAEELLSDEKEIAEHTMLVDLARNDLGRVSEYGTVKVDSFLEIGRFSHVMHLCSKVIGKLREDQTAEDALQAAFPAGTLSGAPKVRAMEIIEELEPTERGIYGGAICYLDYNGQLDSCIAIRTIVLEDGIASVQAGAGVVADSDPLSEYEETINKAKAMMNAINQAEHRFGKVVSYD